MKKVIVTVLLIASIFSFGITAYAGQGWNLCEYGYWYQNADGSYPRNTWQNIDGKWYHFNEYGLVQTGLVYDGGRVYYIDPSTATVVTGWIYYEGFWYYFDPSTGALVMNTITKIDNKTYEFDSTGRCVREITSASNNSLNSILEYLLALITQSSGNSLSNVSVPHISSINDIITTINLYINVARGN